MDDATRDTIAAELLAGFGTGETAARLTTRFPGFGLDEAYRVADRVLDLRRARGERPIGRKIGATNRRMWPVLGAKGPFWGFLYDTTVFDLDRISGVFDLGRYSEPRIEPEIVLRLAKVPVAGLSDRDLLGCVDAVAHGFELVQSPFAGWKFLAADATAAFGLHMALLLGPWHVVSAGKSEWAGVLTDLTVRLSGPEGVSGSGTGRDVLGGPLEALRFLVNDLAAHPEQMQLSPGDLVSTGTLTLAMPVQSGQRWSTEIDGGPLQGLSVTFS